MADIDVRCSQCDANIRVSEFADVSKMSCLHCGGTLVKPQGLISHNSKPTVRLAAHKYEAPEKKATETHWTFNETINRSKQLKEETEKKKVHVSHHFLSWLLFIILGGAMYAVRYMYMLPPAQFVLLQQYSMHILLAIYVMITIRAYSDTIYQGILCTIIPCYPFYYIFGVSNNFYLRALVGAALIAIGQDGGQDLASLAKEWAKDVDHFFATGGGEIR